MINFGEKWFAFTVHSRAVMSVEVNAESNDPIESGNSQPLPKRPRTQQFAVPLTEGHHTIEVDKLDDNNDSDSQSNCPHEFESVGPDSQESEVPTVPTLGSNGVDVDGVVADADSSQVHDADEAAGHPQPQPESEFDSQETLPLDFWENNDGHDGDDPGSDSEAESSDSQEYIGPPSPERWNRFLQHIAAGGEVKDFDWGYGNGPASEVLIAGASPGVYLRLSAAVPINSADSDDNSALALPDGPL